MQSKAQTKSTRARKPMTDSSEPFKLGNIQTLRTRLFGDGYLLIRNALSREVMQGFIDNLVVPSEFQGTYHFGTQLMMGPSQIKARQPDVKEGITTKNDASRLLNTNDLGGVMKELARVIQLLLGDHATLFPNEGWLRMKRKPPSGTIPHADFFFFEGDGFAQKILGDKKEIKPIDPEECHLCRLKRAAREQYSSVPQENADRYCDICAESFIPFYTCWMPLSAGDTDLGDSVLEILESSHFMHGFAERRFDREVGQELPKFFRQQQRDYVWLTPGKINIGDLILFNCKTVHRAPDQERLDASRMSMDVRAFDFRSGQIGLHKGRILEQSRYCLSLIPAIFEKTLSRCKEADTVEFWQDQNINLVFLHAAIAKLRNESQFIHQIKSMSAKLFDVEKWSGVSPIHVIALHWLGLPIDKTWWHYTTIRNLAGPPSDVDDVQDAWWNETFEKWLLTDKKTRTTNYPGKRCDWTPDFVFTWHRLQLQDEHFKTLNPGVLCLRQALLEWAWDMIQKYAVNLKLKWSELSEGGKLDEHCGQVIYFVTHVIFCLSEWGQQAQLIKEHFTSAQIIQLWKLFDGWLEELFDQWSAVNFEVLHEVATCWILLRENKDEKTQEDVSLIECLIQQSVATPRQILHLPKHHRGNPMTSYHTAFTLGFLLETYLKYTLQEKC